MKLILLGAPGAGKGTQAEVISEKYNIPTISTGNIIRAALKNGTEMGLKAKAYIDSGRLVPDDVVIGIIKERLAQDDCNGGFILDGFPRTIPQAAALDELLNKHNAALDIVVGLEVEEDELIARLINRGKTSGRSDDNMETIKKRLEVYNNQTNPLRNHYKEQGKYVSIHGMGSVEDIFGRIKEAIDAL